MGNKNKNNSKRHSNEYNRTKPKNNSIVKKFVGTLFITLVVVLGLMWLGYAIFLREDDGTSVKLPTFSQPENVNALLVGVDPQGLHTDTMMIANLNTGDSSIDLLSVPRDTHITMLQDNLTTLQQEGKPVPSSGEMKINAIYNYAGKEQGITMLEDQLTYETGMDIDFYFLVDINAFEYIVDEIGGVDMNVPKDIVEKGVTVVSAGQQTLDGEKALWVVRHRKSYSNADLGRIEMQQLFMEALVDELTDGENSASDTLAILKTCLKYVETDMSIKDLTKYAGYLKDASSSNMRVMTLPGTPQTVNGKSYVFKNEEETVTLVQDILSLTSTEDTTTEEEPETISSTGRDIQVLNGGYTSGKAGSTADTLRSAGFTVSNVGDYDGEKTENTRIYVTEEGMGEDLTSYFSNPEIIVDSTIEYDIKIVIGTND